MGETLTNSKSINDPYSTKANNKKPYVMLLVMPTNIVITFGLHT